MHRSTSDPGVPRAIPSRLGGGLAALRLILLAVLAVVAGGPGGCAGTASSLGGPGEPAGGHPRSGRPNILLVLADDLGVGDVGCYGQQKIRTPSIDRLATEGVRFSDAYAGSCVCAPTRASLLTGLHLGHAAIRTNQELQPEGQMPLPAGEVTIASRLRAAGYATALVGKWGLGPPGSEGSPGRHGFERFYGYLCQRHAHSHRPDYLYRNDQREPLPPGTYAPDRFLDEALAFLRDHGDRPFFLMYATTIPHAALQVPDDSLDDYRGRFDETPYDGRQGYVAHPTPRAAYAAMITRMDRDIGRLLDELERLGVSEDTIVVVASDNGPTWAGGVDAAFFRSTEGRRGLKGQLYEGGIRVPLVVRWPGHAPAGTTRSTPVALWDLAATFAAAAGVDPGATDGVDLAAALRGPEGGPERPLYWEYPSEGGWQALRLGPWKAVRKGIAAHPDAPIELYDLVVDPGETTDVAFSHPLLVEQLGELMRRERRPASVPGWNLPGFQGHGTP